MYFLIFRTYLLRFFYKINLNVRRIVKEDKVLLLIKTFKIYETNHKLIRLGDDGDGGYLVPDDLLGISACFTGGAGKTIKFEYDLANLGIKCFINDYSIDSSIFPYHEKIFLSKKFLGTENSDKYIFFKEYLEKNTSDNQDYILKLDIEGDEYEIFQSLTEENLKRMRIIIFEIHDFTNIIAPLGFEIIKKIFSKLQKNHSIVHICPNNVTPGIKFSKKLTLFDQLEITLLRNDRIIEKNLAKNFPHSLDSKGNSIFNNRLPKCFYDWVYN